MTETHHCPPPNLPNPPAQHQPTAPHTPIFHEDKHISYWLRCLRQPLPQQYIPNDSNRMLFAFFTVSALDLLGVLFTRTTKPERDAYIAWIYRHQHPDGGFRAFTGTDFGDLRNEANKHWDPANIPGTYLALTALCVLRDDLTRVRRKACLKWLDRMQRPAGSFGQTLGIDGHVEGGLDTRFGYCAMVTRWILRGDMDGEVEGVPDVDIEALMRCVKGSETYDGGTSDEPFHEAHAGYTYCAIGCLYFLKNRLPLPRSARPPQEPLDDRTKALGLADPEATLRWLLSRITDFVEEEHLDDDTDAEGDVETLSTASSTANDIFQTPDTSFSSIHDYFTSESPHPHPFENFGGDAANSSSSMPPPHLLDANLVKVGPGLSPDDETRPSTAVRTGFNGRANKLADTCYAFWVGGSLSIFRSLHLIDHAPIRRYLLGKTQNVIMGGFGKHTSDLPDIFHSYLGLCALSLFDTDDNESVVAPSTHESVPNQQSTSSHHAQHSYHASNAPHPGSSMPADADAVPLQTPAQDHQHAINGRTGAAESSFATSAAATSIPDPHHPRSSEFTSHPTSTSASTAVCTPIPTKRGKGPHAIDDGTADQGHMLRALDPALCVSLRTREWIEGLRWRYERVRSDGGE